MHVGKPLSLVWLRRDLRLHDHAALFHAAQADAPILPIFIFDTDILARFSNPADHRLSFIADALVQMHTGLAEHGSGVLVLHGSARDIIPRLATALNAGRIVTAEDYEPAARLRDEAVAAALPATCAFQRVKDHVIFAPQEILNQSRLPFKVFTPYSKAWRAALTPLSSVEYKMQNGASFALAEEAGKLLKENGLRVLRSPHRRAING